MKRGFSLIELLIVIAIISLFGFLVFGSLKTSTSKKKPYSIKNLKEVFKSNRDTELLCINKCATCFLRVTGSQKTTEVSSKLKELQAYILDKNDNPQKIDFGRMDDQPICLRYHYYTNGSTSVLILASEEKFFYLPSYFGKVTMFDSLQDAAEAWKGDTKNLTSAGGYY